MLAGLLVAMALVVARYSRKSWKKWSAVAWARCSQNSDQQQAGMLPGEWAPLSDVEEGKGLGVVELVV